MIAKLKAREMSTFVPNRKWLQLTSSLHFVLAVITAKTMDSGEYTWNVDKTTLQQMKQSSNKQRFMSPTFEIAGLSWRIEAYPNGRKTEFEGCFSVFLKSVHMPVEWDYIECCYRMQCIELMTGYTKYREFRKAKGSGWSKDAMLLSEIQTLNSLTFTIEISIHRIVLKEDKRIFYERDIVASHQAVGWRIDQELLRKLKSAHIGKDFISDIYGGMYCCNLQRRESHYAFYLILCALPTGERSVNVSCTVDIVAKGIDFEKQINGSWTRELTIAGSGGTDAYGKKEIMSIQDIMKSDSLIFNINITVNDDQKAIDHWNQIAQRQDNDDEKNESNISNVHKTDSNEQSNERFLLMKARIDSLESAIESLSSSVRGLTTKMEQVTPMITALDTLEQKLNRNHKQSMAIQEQAAEAMQSKFDEMQHHITSIDSKLKEVQKRTDGKFRRQSESNQSQSAEVLAMMNQLKEEVAALKKAQNQGDEELKEETEEMKLKKWMEDEVKLPQYFALLKENGFEDLDGVQDLTENDLREMGIEKMGHRRKIIKFVSKLKVANNQSVSMQEHHIPVAAAAYSFGVAQPAKIDAEGPNLVDTGR